MVGIKGKSGKYKRTKEQIQKLSFLRKGKVSPNKGKKFSENWKKNLSESHKGKKLTKEQKEKISKKLKGRISPMLGKKQTEESNLKRSLKLRGEKKSEETKRKMSITKKKLYKEGKIEKMFGDKNPSKRLDIRKKLSEQKKGNKNPCYKKHPWNYIDGRGIQYCDDWQMIRKIVLERDSYICQRCKQHKPLDIHHIIPFRNSLDNSLNNLISLCRKCHIQEEIKFWKSQNE